MQQTLLSLPESPGVYQFFDKNGKLLYVGKAKNLKNRVRSYFQSINSLSPALKLGIRINRMITEASELGYIIVDNESDALVLENSLIKQLKPKYNILLRDDKTYPYIYIDESDDFPRLDLTRKIIIKNKGKIKYFGPFVSGGRELLNAIYSELKLVQKVSCLRGKKACLFYQMQMCLAPCQFSVDKAEYNKILTAAISYINDPSKLIPKLTQKMHFLSEELRFEEAQKIKLQIETLKMLMPTSSVDLANNDNYDLITISEGEECACVIRFFIRDGKLISSSHTFIDYFDSDKNLFDIHEAYTQAIFDFYADETPNNINEVVVPIILDDKDWLISSIKSKSSKTVKITKATGDKEALCKIALRNGYELLKNKKNEDRALYFELKSFFDLVSTPFRIEAFDNSHMSAQACVASMIVWEGKFDKNSYRKYHLESTSEYTQMKEVLTRRAKNFLELPPPDMWLIDGGKANYDLAVDIINSSGANVEVLAIAKEKRDAKSVRSKSKAEDKIVCKNGVIKLPNHDPKLLFLQKLRDEAHRFAIEFHRKQKLKEDKTIKMLQIKGIKEGKLKKLLNFFGSFETIANAQKEQIENILGAKDAELIVNYFTNNNHADVK